jgi:GT2 family glycosyltransferase
MLDNGCPEKTGQVAEDYIRNIGPYFGGKVLHEKSNIGFAAAMNLLNRESSAPFVLFLNQDVTLEPDHLRTLVGALGRHPDWAGVCGTLFRKAVIDSRLTIDTTGHVIFRDRIVRNRGAGKTVESIDSLPYEEGEVFGLSAACALYRREALEAVREEEGPLDPDFFAYFEDIDLDYRLHRSGWKMGHTPGAIGFHELAGSGGRKELRVRLRAYGNRRRIMWKHESMMSLLPDAIPILAQEVYGFVKALLTDPLAWLTGPWIFMASIPSILRRRKRLDRLFGKDRKWIRIWLRPQHERWRVRA